MPLKIGEREHSKSSNETYAVHDEDGERIGAVYRDSDGEWGFVLHLNFPTAATKEDAVREMEKALAVYKQGLAASHRPRRPEGEDLHY